MHIVKTLSVLTIVSVTQDFLEMGTLARVKNTIYIFDAKSHITRVTIIYCVSIRALVPKTPTDEHLQKS